MGVFFVLYFDNHFSFLNWAYEQSKSFGVYDNLCCLHENFNLRCSDDVECGMHFLLFLLITISDREDCSFSVGTTRTTCKQDCQS